MLAAVERRGADPEQRAGGDTAAVTAVETCLPDGHVVTWTVPRIGREAEGEKST